MRTYEPSDPGQACAEPNYMRAMDRLQGIVTRLHELSDRIQTRTIAIRVPCAVGKEPQNEKGKPLPPILENIEHYSTQMLEIIDTIDHVIDEIDL